MRAKITLLLFTCMIFTMFSQEETKKENTVTTFYLINSAEKKPVTEEQKDPYLTDEGLARSKKWAEVLNFVKLDAIYAVNTTSAKQTAQSIAETQKASVYQFDINTMYDASFKYLTDGKNILIVSDATTSTKFANLVIGMEKYKLVENDNFGVIHIITVNNDSKTPIVLNIN